VSLLSSSRCARRPAELSHDKALLVTDGLRDCVLARWQDELSSAERQLEPRVSQPPSKIIGKESSGRGDQRAAVGAAGDTMPIARAQPAIALLQKVAEMTFDGSGGGHDDRQGLRVNVLLETGQVNDSDQLTGFRVVDGSRRAGPGLNWLNEVLGGEDLHGVIGCQGSPDGVGPSAALAPQRALGEVHRISRQRADSGVALECEQRPSRVAHDDQVV
jgi:hypothetical protein